MHLTACICTRDRGANIAATLRSLAASTCEDFDVLIVDQSTNDDTALTVHEITAGDKRFRYLRSATQGLSAARNVAISQARGSIIAFTDDDCTVEPGWAMALQETFAAHPEVGVIFGTVRAAPSDASAGILPTFDAEEGPVTRKKILTNTSGCWGMGANMALRRSVWEQVGPFDELMGAGAPLCAAEDTDYWLRAIACGVGVYHSGRACVVHYGFRPQAATSKLMKGYALGKGAMYAKQLRAGNSLGTRLLIREIATLIRDISFNALRRRRPLGANLLIYEVKGLWRGIWLPLERRQQLVFRGEAGKGTGDFLLERGSV